jgi:uncharacterized protein YbaR (Trm112 family)
MVIAAPYARRPYTLNEMQKSLIDETVSRLETVLRLLACPVCHAGLALLDAETVLCSGCGRRYSIRDGLPVLLVPTAPQ